MSLNNLEIQVKDMLLSMPSGVSGFSQGDAQFSFACGDLVAIMDVFENKLNLHKGDSPIEANDALLRQRIEAMSSSLEQYQSQHRSAVLERAKRSRNWREES